MVSTFKLIAAAAGIFAAISLPAYAQDYPTKPVTIVVPYSAGGTTDIYARLLARKLEPIIKQTVLVDNKPGASQMIGAQAVASAANDGYTLLLTAANTLTSVPLLYKDVRYSVDDFAPVSTLAQNPYALVVSNSFKGETFNDLIEHAKANPRKVTYGSTGFGTGTFLAGRVTEQATGTQFVEVPFKSLGDALIELAAGRLDFIPGGLPEALRARDAGQGRIVAVFDTTRSKQAPDVPAIGELGYPDLVIWNWYAIMAPAGLPAPVAEYLHEAIAKAAADPEFQERLAKDGMVVEVSGPETVADMIRKETESRKALIETANIDKQ
jgi:tripartite-type tricarboxylate transporter receptor subunit TctC